MLIEDYSFGKITIKGQRYTSDLLIYETEIKEDWWRKEGHSLCQEDLTWILERDPDTLIIGTGKNGVMKVPQLIENKLIEQGMEVVIEPTDLAIKTFNEKYSAEEEKIAAGFHLTC